MDLLDDTTDEYIDADAAARVVNAPNAITRAALCELCWRVPHLVMHALDTAESRRDARRA